MAEQDRTLADRLRACLRFDHPDPSDSLLEQLARQVADELDRMAASPAAYMSPDGTRTMPAVIFDDWKAQRPDDAAGWVALAPIPKSSALPAEHIETAEGMQVRYLGGGAVAIDFDPPLADADRRRLESALKSPQAMEAITRTGSVVAAIEAAQWKRDGSAS